LILHLWLLETDRCLFSCKSVPPQFESGSWGSKTGQQQWGNRNSKAPLKSSLGYIFCFVKHDFNDITFNVYIIFIKKGVRSVKLKNKIVILLALASQAAFGMPLPNSSPDSSTASCFTPSKEALISFQSKMADAGIPLHPDSDEIMEGEYVLTLKQFEELFGTESPRRQTLMNALHKAAKSLKSGGVKTLKIGGSFIGAKENPRDIDGCWEETKDVHLQNSMFNFRNRNAINTLLSLDLYVCSYVEAKTGLEFSQFFQRGRNNAPKGIIAIYL
jgi:hypothetical protein